MKKDIHNKRKQKKYRLVIIDDSTFHEVVTIRLTKIKIYSLFSLLFIFFLFLIIAVLVFTPIKYAIPGYGSYKLRQKYLKLKEKTDSLEVKMRNNANYIEMLKSAVKDEEEKNK